MAEMALEQDMTDLCFRLLMDLHALVQAFLLGPTRLHGRNESKHAMAGLTQAML
jgi:hypothetical protein